jgi:hypothetical protein
MPGLAKGQFTAIPRSDANLDPDAHIQAIANTAGFHMPTIEQGGQQVWKCFESYSVSDLPKPSIFKPGPTKRTMHYR